MQPSSDITDKRYVVFCKSEIPIVAKKIPQAVGGEFCYCRISEFFTLWLSPSKISRWL